MTQTRKMPVEARHEPDTATGRTTVASFEIQRVAFLDHHGNVIAAVPEFARDPQNLIALYRSMMLTRTFDAKAIALQRTGQLGTYASIVGEEAISAAVGAAMDANDVLLPSYRHVAAQFTRGVRPSEVLLYWGGDERGSDFANC